MELAERVANVLGGRAVLKRTVRTWTDLEQVVHAGLPKRALQFLASRTAATGVAPSEFVYSVVPSATFKRRTRLSPAESERTERIARIVALAEALWDDDDQSREFLNRPHPLLDGDSPLHVARTELGARRVERLLHDVEHGLPL